MLKKQTTIAGAKILAAGATVFAIGWGMLVLQPKPEAPVAEAEADIFAFEFAQKTQQQRFIQSLMQEGFEEPRAYDHNGNKMFFSTTVTNESPREAMARLQRSFVDTGLNKHVHMRRPTAEPLPDVDKLKKDRKLLDRHKKFSDDRVDYMNDFIGGVVPIMTSEDAVMMAGATTRESADSYDQWAAELVQMRENSPPGTVQLSESVKAMRYVDAFREGPNRTRLSAVWSDTDYQAKKIANIGDDINVDPDVPVCPGCKRLMHFEGKTEKEFANNAFNAGGQSVDQVLSFYRRAFEGRGWKVSNVDKVLNAAERTGLKPPNDEAQMLQFARGTEFMTVVAWPGSKGTGVQIARAN